MLSRFQDNEKVANLKENLPKFEEFCKKNLDGKFFGGENPMYLDMHCFPIFERMALLDNSPWKHGWDALDIKNTCPTILEYVGRFREHPKMKPHVVNPEVNNNHLKDWLTKEPGVKA